MKREWKYVTAMVPWLWGWVTRKDVVWVACGPDVPEGERETVEKWTPQLWQAVRPRYWGLLKRLPCGCSRRLGRMTLFSMTCSTHSPTTAEWFNEEKEQP